MYSLTDGAGAELAPEVVEVLDDETELLDPDATHHDAAPPSSARHVPDADDDIVDAEIVDDSPGLRRNEPADGH